MVDVGAAGVCEVFDWFSMFDDRRRKMWVDRKEEVMGSDDG